jgi:ribosome-binding factor A
MRPYRHEKIESLIQQELSKIVAREIEPPTGTLVTISHVEVNPDNTEAKIGVSVIPTESTEDVVSNLKKRQGWLQRLLNHKMNIKPMPRINFEADYGLDKAAKIDKLLREV